MTITPEMRQPDRLEVYAKRGDIALPMHMFLPSGSVPEGGRPAIVFFFGGGWNSGTPAQFYPFCTHLAARGMVAMAAEYRVHSRHGVTPFDCVADAKSAMRWVRGNAQSLGIDPSRIVAGGGSAGGHLALSTAFICGMDAKDDDLAISPVPDALVGFNPVIDTTPAGFGAHRLGERAQEISPAHHVRAGAPPCLLFHGTADTTVPFENAERFTRLMREAENRCRLVPFEGEAHGFFNYRLDEEGHINPVYLEVVRLMDDFLVELGLLAELREPVV